MLLENWIVKKKLLIRSNAIIMHADNMFLSHQQSESAEKSKLKTVLNTIIQSQLDDLSSKTEILQLNILSLSESFE